MRSAARTDAEVVERTFAGLLVEAEPAPLRGIPAQSHTGTHPKGRGPTR